jgi:cell division septal protein FtsQ
MAGHGGSLKRQTSARRASPAGRSLKRGRGLGGQTAQYQVAMPVLERKIGYSRVQVSPLLIDVLLLVLVGVLLYWMAMDGAFYVSRMSLKGDQRLSEAELLAASGLEGMHIFWVDTGAAERAIAALPGVESVQVSCGLPANCQARVVQERPLLVWRQGDAQVWIGAGGTVLPAVNELPSAIAIDAIGSTTFKPGDRVERHLVEGVLELKRLQPLVRAYQYAPDRGLSFQSDYGWEVRLGEGQQVGEKLELMHAFASFFQKHGITPRYLDVRFPEAPVYGE